jgi:hypothetical protein
MTTDKNKEKVKPFSNLLKLGEPFTLNEPQIQAIFGALEQYMQTLDDWTEMEEEKLEKGKDIHGNDMTQEHKEDIKNSIKTWDKEGEIVSHLYEYFKHLEPIIDGLPDIEPILKCEYVIDRSTLKMNYEERAEFWKRNDKLWDYKRKKK